MALLFLFLFRCFEPVCTALKSVGAGDPEPTLFGVCGALSCREESRAATSFSDAYAFWAPDLPSLRPCFRRAGVVLGCVEMSSIYVLVPGRLAEEEMLKFDLGDASAGVADAELDSRANKGRWYGGRLSSSVEDFGYGSSVPGMAMPIARPGRLDE